MVAARVEYGWAQEWRRAPNLPGGEEPLQLTRQEGPRPKPPPTYVFRRQSPSCVTDRRLAACGSAAVFHARRQKCPTTKICWRGEHMHRATALREGRRVYEKDNENRPLKNLKSNTDFRSSRLVSLFDFSLSVYLVYSARLLWSPDLRRHRPRKNRKGDKIPICCFRVASPG